MRRQQPALKLKESPLVMVLAQVRFTPVLKMADYVPGLQESFRHGGFPRFKEQTIREIVFGPQVEVKEAKRWLFANADNTEAVVLSGDFVVLETNRYVLFENFAEKLQSVLQTVGAQVGLSLAHRLGLRFVDLILPREGENLQEYLRPQLHGLNPKDLGVEDLLNQFEARGATPEGQLVIRLHQNTQGTFLPPDLHSTALSFDDGPDKGRLITLLDIDHFSEKDREFSAEEIIEAMWRLHDFTDRAFLASVTPEALERWGKE